MHRWIAGNVLLETDAAGNWKSSKKKSIEHIDGSVALITAIEQVTIQPGKWHLNPAARFWLSILTIHHRRQYLALRPIVSRVIPNVAAAIRLSVKYNRGS